MFFGKKPDPIPATPVAPAAVQPQPAAGQAKDLAAVRNRLHAAFGQVVLAMTAVPRYRHLSLTDLQTAVLEPLMRDRIAIAQSRTSDPAASEAGDVPVAGAPLAGIAIWATVSEAVDAKIREQIAGGTFPVHLKQDEWTSGDRVWLLDVIAPSQKMASSVLASFKQLVTAGSEVRIHPIVARQVDPELLKRLMTPGA